MFAEFMRAAIGKAREGIAAGQSPFGACITRESHVISCAHNLVWRDVDITAHAEIVAIRNACHALKTVDLSGCVIYSTCEPCPMCFAACHWAKLSKIVFGSRIADARRAGFSELNIGNEEMKRAGGSPMEIAGDFLREEALVLFDEFLRHPGARTY